MRYEDTSIYMDPESGNSTEKTDSVEEIVS